MLFFGCFKKTSENATHKALYKEIDDDGYVIKNGKTFSIQDGIIITGINGNEARLLNENAKSTLIFYGKSGYLEHYMFIIVNLLGDYVTYCECPVYELSCALENYAESIEDKED